MATDRLFNIFRSFTITTGLSLCAYSAWRLPYSSVDLGYFVLVLFITLFGSWATLQLPRIRVHLSFYDIVIFLTLLLYGCEAAVLVGAAEGLCNSIHFKRVNNRKLPFVSMLFNVALMAISTFVTNWVIVFGFGPIEELVKQGGTLNLIIVLWVMAITQYSVNTFFAASHTSFREKQSIFHSYIKYYFGTYPTFIAGAMAAGLLYALLNKVGIYTLPITAPFIIILYITQRRYLDDMRETTEKAEEAERARAEAERKRAEIEHERAEAERKRAEQAESHVDELNFYIAEQERISRELADSKDHFRHAAFHDSLTGLPNRAMFVDHLKSVIDKGRKFDHYRFAVLFVDLDRFKNINDSLGHNYGDKLLCEIARRLRSSVRNSDIVARFGGDEFALLLDGLNEPNDATRIAEKILVELAVPFHLDEHEAYTSGSIGIALSSPEYREPEDLLRDADTAMYRAKESGKGRCELFDKAMHSRALARLQLETDLRRAIEREQFYVNYQPILHLKKGEIYGFEALVRWKHPDKGIVSPAEFIPIAEETGLIVAIGEWVMEEACRQMKRWQEKYSALSDAIISINLSGRQLAQHDLISHVKRILDDSSINPSTVKLEITESVVMENAEMATSILNELRMMGFQLSIDDFGTGYSSLSYLHRFPVNTLKIDRSFVSRIEQGDENLEIVRTIVNLARNLGMEVVAEGIETERQLNHLKLLSCKYGQGYLFSKPLDVSAAEKFIEENPFAQTQEIEDNSVTLDERAVFLKKDEVVNV
jgi:diguanylate cyclase (GGDEF)-like protein